jgi:hypothetical protein
MEEGEEMELRMTGERGNENPPTAASARLTYRRGALLWPIELPMFWTGLEPASCATRNLTQSLSARDMELLTERAV